MLARMLRDDALLPVAIHILCHAFFLDFGVVYSNQKLPLQHIIFSVIVSFPTGRELKFFFGNINDLKLITVTNIKFDIVQKFFPAMF